MGESDGEEEVIFESFVWEIIVVVKNAFMEECIAELVRSAAKLC